METVQILKIDTNPAQTSIKELRNQLKAFKDEMAGLEEGSDAFLEVATKAGAVKHQIDEITQTVNGASADFGDMLGNATTALNGIIGGFTAAQGALSLFGIESEEVLESIKKLQSLMAIGQGIAQIDNGIKALAKLNAAIVGTSKSAKILKAALQPKVLTAVTIALTGLYILWQKFGDKIKESLPILGKISNFFSSTKDDVDALTKSQNEYNNAVKKTNDLLAKHSYDEKYNALSKTNKALVDDLKKQRDYAQDLLDTYNEQQQKLKDNQKEWERVTELGLEQKAIIKDISDQIDSILTDPTKTQEYEDRVNVVLNRYKELEKVQKTINDSFDDTVELLYSYVKEKEKLTPPELPELEDEEMDSYTQRLLDTYNNFRNSVTDSYTSLLMTDEEYFDASERALNGSLRLKLISQQEYSDALKRLQKEQAQYEINNSLQVANDIADILNSAADAQDTNNKEGFEKSKKLQISAATIQMLTGITAAISGAFTTHTGVWDIVLAATQAASIAASGIANIKKIQAQTYNGTSTSTPTTTLSGNVTNTLTAPVEYSTAIENAKTRATIQSNRVYVLESDIRNTGNAVNVAESESRY